MSGGYEYALYGVINGRDGIVSPIYSSEIEARFAMARTRSERMIHSPVILRRETSGWTTVDFPTPEGHSMQYAVKWEDESGRTMCGLVTGTRAGAERMLEHMGSERDSFYKGRHANLRIEQRSYGKWEQVLY